MNKKSSRELSRREFVIASAAGLVGFACGSQRLASQMQDSDLFYVGTYTEGSDSKGIYMVRMDSRTGALSLIGSVDAGANPSFLTIHPNCRVLYAVNEVEKYSGKSSGGVSSFAIAEGSGALTRINEQASEGATPCYVSVDRTGHVVLVANYDGGSIALLPVDASGSLAAAAQVVHHKGTGPNAERQEAPHAHCIRPDPSNHFVLAADLGADRVFVYRLDVAGNSLSHVEGGDAVMRAGAGPRHIAFHPTLPLVFVANELDSTVATLRFDAERGTLTLLSARSTLPAGWTGTNYPADIHVAPSGQTVYVSNRGHNSISVFAVAQPTGELALVQTVSTEGDWPRNFTQHPNGRWLLAANQRSNSIVVFERDGPSGRLTAIGERIAIPSPVCLQFRNT